MKVKELKDRFNYFIDEYKYLPRINCKSDVKELKMEEDDIDAFELAIESVEAVNTIKKMFDDYKNNGGDIKKIAENIEKIVGKIEVKE